MDDLTTRLVVTALVVGLPLFFAVLAAVLRSIEQNS